MSSETLRSAKEKFLRDYGLEARHLFSGENYCSFVVGGTVPADSATRSFCGLPKNARVPICEIEISSPPDNDGKATVIQGRFHTMRCPECYDTNNGDNNVCDECGVDYEDFALPEGLTETVTFPN